MPKRSLSVARDIELDFFFLRPKDKIKAVFRKYDLNNDGFIKQDVSLLSWRTTRLEGLWRGFVSIVASGFSQERNVSFARHWAQRNRPFALTLGYSNNLGGGFKY